MIAVLLRLQWMTLKGRVVRSIRLLRQPKYAVGFVIGSAWIGSMMIRPLLRSHIGVAAMPWGSGDEAFATTIHRMVALVVTVLVPLPWLLPWGPLGLAFRESELTMLLQAPLTRRQVTQYGLLKSEVGVVFGALILSLVRARNGPWAWLLSFLGTWMLFDFWHLNGRWRALFNLRQREIPLARARWRRLLLATGLLAFYAVLVLALVPFLAQVGAALQGADFRQVLSQLTALAWPPLFDALSAPGWWLTAPIFAHGGVKFLAAIVPVLLMIVAQRELVLRSKARFEERALEHAKAKEARKSPTRRFARASSRARSRRPFSLDRPGPAALAVVWKNCMRVSRVPWTWLSFAGPTLLLAIAVLPALLRLHDVTYGVLACVGACLAIFLPPFGAMLWNNDLRTEIAHIELVRTWPLAPERFVLAEVASPALVSFVASTFGAGVVLTSLYGSRLREALTGEPTQLVLLPRSGAFLGVDNALAALVLFASFLPMASAVSFVSSAFQNLAVLFVPAWMAHSADRSRGVAAFGGRMLFFSALALVLSLALIPSAVVVGAALFAQWMLGIAWSAWELPFWTTLAAAPLFLVGWLIVQVAARLWHRLDPAQEVLEIGR